MRPIVTLTLDDCWQTQADAFRHAFDSASLRGVFYAIAAFVGEEVNGFQFVEWDELRQISSEGHEIGSHSLTHRGSTLGPTAKARQLIRLLRNKGPLRTARLTSALLRLAEEYPGGHSQPAEEIGMSKQMIEKELGTPCRSYSYPGGEPTSDLIEFARQAGYTSARTVRPGFNHIHDLEPYALRCQVWDRWTTARVADRWVDKAISENCWLIEVFHAINLPHYPYSCSESSLKKHLSYIRSRQGEIENLTVCESIDQSSRDALVDFPKATFS